MWAFRRRVLRRPLPAQREVTWKNWYGLTQAWGSTTYTTGLWGRSYLGVGRRVASRAWQRALSNGRHGFTVRETLPWKNTHMGLPNGESGHRTPSPVQGLTGVPGELTPVLGLRRLRNWTGGGKRRSHPRMRGNVAWHQPALPAHYLLHNTRVETGSMQRL